MTTWYADGPAFGAGCDTRTFPARVEATVPGTLEDVAVLDTLAPILTGPERS